MKKEAEVIAHNLALPGQGLRFGLQSTCVARCASGIHVLRGGLGAMGVGQMWGWASEVEQRDDEFAALPVQSCHSFGIVPLFQGQACSCCECKPAPKDSSRS